MNRLLIFAVAALGCTFSVAQETLVLQPNGCEGQDALLHGMNTEVNVNRGDQVQFGWTAWTVGSNPSVVREVLRFDLSTIPAESEVTGAYLSLYHYDNITGNGLGAHSTLSGSNASWIERVIEPWDEATVTWANQPATTPVDRVAMPASTSALQDYPDMDVTALVQAMVDVPEENYGFLFKLQTEEHYRNMNFASSDHPYAHLRPKLVVEYIPNADAVILGCTSDTACNYNPDANADDGSCCEGICGCMDPAAVNFNLDAVCDDDSCLYPFWGHVYDDEDENGNWDDDEYGLANKYVYIADLDLLLLTNDVGMFYTLAPDCQIWTQVGDCINLPYNTSPEWVSANAAAPGFDGITFGISKEMPDFAICTDFYPNGATYLCDDLVNHNICFRNNGNVPIYGTVEVTYDELFQGHQAVTPIDSADGNTVYMSYTDLLPGQMFMFDILLHSPTVDHIGEIVTSEARVTGFYNGEQVASGEQELQTLITCAYDPNDKQVFPPGETDAHLTLAEDELEFLIRFQNTGNAPATDVLLRDTLDDHLDLSTFQLMANSHSVFTQVNTETREVSFYFQDIMLPDSTCCEADSKGLVSYTIRPYPDLEAGTVIENTAYIFFDNNPPIVTNTTWNTIHECPDEINLSASLIESCPGSATHIGTDYDLGIPWSAEFEWKIGNDVVGTDPTIVLAPNYTTDETLFLTINDPLCQSYGQETFTLAFNWTTCTGDVNCNEEVDTFDILAILAEYACNGAECFFDFNGDQEVGSPDLLMILGEYGAVCD